MRKSIIIFVVLVVLFSLTACGAESVTPDYTDAESFEKALNSGADLTGKIVQFKVIEIVPNSMFGYNLQAGEHLNFCSTKNPGVSIGDTVTVKVKDVTSMFGSYIISYTKK